MKLGALAGVALALGCTQPAVRRTSEQRKASGDRHVLLKVPFYTDDTDQCGPSALGSVLGYWGQGTQPAQLQQEVYLKHLKGSLPVDLILAAQSRGMTVRMLNGTLTKVKRELRSGHPLIAFMNVGFRFLPVWHYVVLTGYDDRRGEIFMHTGTQRNEALAYDRFSKQWERAEKWALLILPKRRT